MRTLIDLSHSIADGTKTYPGLPGPIICDFLSREASRSHYADGVSFSIPRIDMVSNTGTYIDSPFHRYADGIDLAHLPLASVADLPAIVCRAEPGRRDLGVDLFAGHNVTGKAVLIATGWSRYWGTSQYFEGHPFLTAAAADFLLSQRATLVGIDSLNIDDTDDLHRPVHSTLLGANIPIVEHMCNLERLPADGFRFHAAPVKVHDFGTFPVRAYAVVDE